MLLAACAALPISSTDSISVLLLILKMLRTSIGAAIVACLTFGAPHGFAIAVAFAARGGGKIAIKAVHVWTIVVHVALVLFALEVRALVQDGLELVAPFALFGFAIVATIRYGMLVAARRSDLVADVRHGALAIIGAFAWLELQAWAPHANPDSISWWTHGTLVTAIFVLRVARRTART